MAKGKVEYKEEFLYVLEGGLSYDYSLDPTPPGSPGNGYAPGLGNGAGNGYSWSNNTSEMLKTDIEQSHHYTVSIDKISKYIPSFTTRFKDSYEFLPVKSIDYTVGSVGTMSFPLGVLGEFPIINKQNFGRMTLVFYDTDREPVERAVRSWFDYCFPKDKYVNYLSNIIGTMYYKSYGVTGRLNENVSGNYLVIPVDSLSLNRGYDENSAKLFQLTLLVVGKLDAFANSSRTYRSDLP